MLIRSVYVNMKKYNLSFTRLLSRFFFTIVLTIIFGLAMIPFMRTADGLLYEQRAAIGGENMLRTVILWAVFTALFSVVTFWKKRFRMVSVFLIIFWLLGTGIVGLLEYSASTAPVARCQRANPFVLEPEINRALDLIVQRLDIENNPGSYYGRAFDYRNCLNIQYSDVASEMDLEGGFMTESPTDALQVVLHPQYKTYDDLSIATILIHELTHVGQEIYQRETKEKLDCFAQEADAFTAQSIFLNQLHARLREDVDLNPALGIVLSVEEKTQDSIVACTQLKEANSLTETQYNECVWTGTRNKMEQEVKNDEAYQQQCNAFN
jgi:hypothetical protein